MCKFAGSNPAVNGSYKVVGNTGAIAAHAVPFANDLVLFLIRPNARIDFGGETTALPNEAYLLGRSIRVVLQTSADSCRIATSLTLGFSATLLTVLQMTCNFKMLATSGFLSAFLYRYIYI